MQGHKLFHCFQRHVCLLCVLNFLLGLEVTSLGVTALVRGISLRKQMATTKKRGDNRSSKNTGDGNIVNLIRSCVTNWGVLMCKPEDQD